MWFFLTYCMRLVSVYYKYLVSVNYFRIFREYKNSLPFRYHTYTQRIVNV